MWSFLICVLLVIQNLVLIQSHDHDQSPPSPVAPSRPSAISNIWSDLGDMILDVDEKLYRLTVPRGESEHKKNGEGDGRSVRKNYFDRIRDNYKSLHEEIGQTLNAPVLKMPEILNLNFQNRGQKSSLDLSLPFLPMTVKVDSKAKLPKEPSEGKVTEALKLDYPFSDVTGSVNIGSSRPLYSEKENPPKPEDTGVDASSDEFQKRSSRPNKSTTTRLRQVDLSNSNDLPSDSWEVKKDSTSDSDIQGRILGDLLFSESTFDKYFRQMLKAPGKWLLDSNIRPPKQVVEAIRETTRDHFRDDTSSKSKQKSKSPKQTQGVKQNQYFENEMQSKLKHRNPDFESNKVSSSRVILAFTPEGLPLKLKIDRSISNPLRFLHNALNSAKVSLNIPIDSLEGVQPAGNDVLHLGYGISSMQARTPYLDLSDEKQLNYLLKTLKKLRYELL